MNIRYRIPCPKELFINHNSVLIPISFMINYLGRYLMAHLSVDSYSL